MKWRITGILCGLALAIAAIWWALRSVPSPETGPHSPAAAINPPAPTPSVPYPASLRLSQLANPAASPEQKIHRVHGLLRDYFQAMKNRGGPPLSSNAEFTRAFTGKNPLGVVFLAPDNPAINARGELVDGWSTPYFFHALAADSVEVVSAGPDRIPFNADDLVFPRAGARAPLETLIRSRGK